MDTSWDTDSKLPLPTSLIKIEQSNDEKIEKSLTPKKSSPSGELDKSLFKFKVKQIVLKAVVLPKVLAKSHY